MKINQASIIIIAFALVMTICPIYSNSSKSQRNSCISPDGKAVDWFIIYTLPRSATEQIDKFTYMDNTSEDFKLYNAIPDEFPPIKIALELNKTKEKSSKSKTSYVIWNDDATNGDYKPTYNESFAHSKGLLSFDSKQGVYIIHSLPRFPFRDENNIVLNKFSSNFGIFGQTFFCMSIDFSEVIHVLDVLLSIRPQILMHDISEIHEKNPLIHNKIEKLVEMQKNVQTNDVFKIKTIGGLEVKIFVENKHGFLPWDFAIPEFYEDSFFVETWTRPSLLPNVCAGDKNVMNMLRIEKLGYSFYNTDDHSKWGVSVNKDIVCYGDLNRTNRPNLNNDRLGSVACFEHSKVSKQVKNFVKDYERCEKKDTMKFLYN